MCAVAWPSASISPRPQWDSRTLLRDSLRLFLLRSPPPRPSRAYCCRLPPLHLLHNVLLCLPLGPALRQARSAVMQRQCASVAPCSCITSGRTLLVAPSLTAPPHCTAPPLPPRPPSPPWLCCLQPSRLPRLFPQKSFSCVYFISVTVSFALSCCRRYRRYWSHSPAGRRCSVVTNHTRKTFITRGAFSPCPGVAASLARD